MKKTSSVFLILFLICVSVVGCAKNDTVGSASNIIQAQEQIASDYTESQEQTTSDSTQAQEQTNSDNTEVQEQTNSNNTESQEYNNAAANNDIDIDLTALNSIMVYVEVYNIMKSPEDYMGQTIKMSGPYYTSFYNETDSYYHYVIIEDASACCQSGLEFIWKGEHSYPEDYPADQTNIEVVGVFESYEELGKTYYYLSVDDITILKQ